MKKSLSNLAKVAGMTCALFLFSCEMQDEEPVLQQPIEFSFNIADLPSVGGRAYMLNEDVASVVVSIKDAMHTTVVTSKKLALYNFNGKFVSEPIALLPGNYWLNEFLVLNGHDSVLFACPAEGSAKAYLVVDPLDIKIAVHKSKVAEVVPEVLSVKGCKPQDFGYATFSFKEIATFDFLASVFVYDNSLKKLVLTSATISIRDEDQKFGFSQPLLPGTNQITLLEKYNSYRLKVDKAGYKPYLKTIPTAALKEYNNENGPLTIILEAGNLIFWNKLGSDAEVLNSEVGPDLEFFTGGALPHVPANHEYAAGKFGNAITIAPGNYSSTNRVHNLVLNNLPSLINPERGAMECYFFQNNSPIAYNHNPHRIVDGPYGLLSTMGFVSHDYNEDGKINALSFYLDLGSATPVSVSYMNFGSYNGQWIHVAAVWDRSGIGSSNETMQLYINRTKVAASMEAGWGTIVGQRADIAGGNDNNIARQFYVDELKIYDYAKTNF